VKNLITSILNFIFIDRIRKKIHHINIRRFNQNKKIIISLNSYLNSFEDYKPNYQDLDSKLGILIQGTLDGVECFATQSLYLYRKNFPNAEIVISTWEGESMDRDVCEILKVRTIFSTKPTTVGPLNVNLQILSTRRGLEEFSSRIEYVFKTRTDNRFYNARASNYLTGLLESFAIDSEKKQLSRLVFISEGSLNIDYYLSDRLQFGKLSDMFSFWFNAELIFDNRKIIPEIHLLKSYIDLLEIKENRKIDYKDFLRDYAIIIDSESIDYIWFKYGLSKRSFVDIISNKDLRFINWFMIYRGGQNEENHYCSRN
jgi:hypothetical protein